MGEEKKKYVMPAGATSFPVAATLSYLKWHSLWYAFLHGLCGWYYIIYFTNQYIYHFVK